MNDLGDVDRPCRSLSPGAEGGGWDDHGRHMHGTTSQRLVEMTVSPPPPPPTSR